MWQLWRDLCVVGGECQSLHTPGTYADTNIDVCVNPEKIELFEAEQLTENPGLLSCIYGRTTN